MIAAGQSAARFLRLGAKTLIGILACWLGLIGWSSSSPGGGVYPRPSRMPRMHPVCHLEHPARRGTTAAPWNRFGWPVRRPALRVAPFGIPVPDILCVQEALA